MLRALAALMFAMCLSSAALAERRVALVFGARDYDTLRGLPNAVNDARTIESVLDTLDFKVTPQSNANLRQMRRALENFVEDAAGADVALVFFAGHGVEIGGVNRLLPVDADASSLERLNETSLPLEEVRAALARVAPVNLLILDACRDDPFDIGTGNADPAAEGRGATIMVPQRVRDAARPGLARLGEAENVLFAFSAAPGRTASDGAGSNSPFTTALAKYLPTDGLEIRSVLTLVQQEVYDLSGGGQLPYVESGLPKKFFAAETGTLPERDLLLLAMAGVEPWLRTEVERLAAENEVPLAPLYATLIENRMKDIPPDDRRARLLQAAQAFKQTREKLRTFSSSDPEVARLRAAAEESLSLGAFAEANAHIDRAIEIDRTARETVGAVFLQRTLSEADSHVAKAGLALTELRHLKAIASLEAAAALHAQVEKLDIPTQKRREGLWLFADIGDVHALVGDTVSANASYERMRSAAEQRLSASPGDADAERDLFASQFRVGDMLFRMGDLAKARSAYAAGLESASRLAAGDPASIDHQRDVVFAQIKMGDLLFALGDRRGALSAYEASRAASRELTRRNPGYRVFRRDLFVSEMKIGDIRFAWGDLAGALAAFRAGVDTIMEAASELAGDAGWQRDISNGHNRIGDVRFAQGDLQGALSDYEEGFAIAEQLALHDPNNALWQHDLSISHNKIGDARRFQGDTKGALSSYEAALAIAQRLSARDPGDLRWQNQLAVSHNRIGDLLLNDRNIAGALAHYDSGLAISMKMVALDPINTGWQRDLAVSHNKVGDARLMSGNIAGAGQAYEAAFAISTFLASVDPDNAGWQRDLVVSHTKLARTGDSLAHIEAALEIALEMEQGILLPADRGIPTQLREILATLTPAVAAE